MNKYILCLISLIFLVACDATKKVPEGSYLLNKADIKSDVRGIKKSELRSYLRQKPNSSVPLIGKYKLHMYNIPDNDSTWLNRMLLKYGEPPVLYSDPLTGISAEQIRLHLNNKGYLNAEVDTTVIKKDKKANVTYDVTGNEPHRIRTFHDSINAVDTTIYNILSETKRLDIIKEGDIFDREVLEKGRISMTNQLRNRGYYNFLRDNFYYLADTTVGTHQVDLTLGLDNPSDSTVHKQYYIRDVTIVSGVDRLILDDSTKHFMLDTIQHRGLKIVTEGDQLLLPQAIYYNTFLRPGRLYSDRIVERSYSSLNSLGPIHQTAINLTPVETNDSNYIDANIVLFPGNMHYMQFGVDGTNSQGDLGVAASAMYEHRNIFKGGERLRVRLNAAYEFITTSDSLNLIDKSFYEYGADATLNIPQLLLPWIMQRLRDRPSASTEFSIGANFQKRPEYFRQFFNLANRFQWSSYDWHMAHVLEPIGITYVRMPWKSELFEERYLDEKTNPILKFSYEEQMIVRSAYNLTYTNFNRISSADMPKIPLRIRTGVEVAGWIPRVVSALGGSKTNKDGQEEIWRIPYAEYVKGDIDFAPIYNIDDNNALAARAAIGVIIPYGNSQVPPFEKRYFGGGANSVRGWSTRTLGPGTYNRDSTGFDFGNKIGEIKLDFSVEYRRKLNKLFELGTFIDAGNIWTIKDYVEQPGGKFEWSSFYKELAVAYGAGIRLNLNFLLLRLDVGMKAHNPAMPAGQRWTIFKPDVRRDMALHFAIGYPF